MSLGLGTKTLYGPSLHINIPNVAEILKIVDDLQEITFWRVTERRLPVSSSMRSYGRLRQPCGDAQVLSVFC
ncbi:hypothetical protein TSAR_013060 [Trichomalopsis sarcophagae]|uniref:Uncharacterized protein n=1 Tax=Trichomalopsis sarcophagae TaxID=543379 RepID=A0A232EPF4_9HYME|nr:hypothetical protein TSAR_013060 [Trichomalopsis sarcophagae]